MHLSFAPEHPVSLSAGCVRAVLAGRKSVVRHPAGAAAGSCPLGEPGDLLWVQEPWMRVGDLERRVVYLADVAPAGGAGRWEPARTLPRAHARLLLRVTAVRRERLQAIPDSELPREGALWRDDPAWPGGSERDGFAWWWDSLHRRAEERWARDPEVWVVDVSVEAVGPAAAGTAALPPLSS